jgi:phage terminase small subunit
MDKTINEQIAKLKPEWQTFIKLLLGDKNRIAWKAYMGAYPGVKEEKTARQAASRLLKNVNLAAIIQQFDEKALDDLEITVERINLEKARLAFFNPRKLLHENGIPKKLHELDDDTAAALESFDIEVKADSDGDLVATLCKPRAAKKAPILDQLSKQRGLYEKDNEQKSGGMADLIRAVDGKTRGLPEEDEE